jgi:hydroxymethylglutaryl-CoA lyase
MSFPSSVRIVEVGPRDGLQNEPDPVPIAARVALVDALTASGVAEIEVGSFVSPARVPQMAGTGAVFAAIRRDPRVLYSALVPNLHGLADAQASGVTEISVFVSASESFSKHNINCGIAQSLERAGAVVARARASELRVRGYVSCVLGCPYEGAVDPDIVARIALDLQTMGCRQISLGDTIGVGTPRRARSLIDRVARDVPLEALALHFHDTYGQALANIFACLELGVSTIDSAVAGLGGCPYAPGAGGNVATEDVVFMLNGMGIDHGIDLELICQAGRHLCSVLGRQTGSRVARARPP